MTETAAYGHSARAQWTTGPRLLKLGESIELRFSLPDGVRHRDLAVFPRYLERAEPGDAFSLDGGLG